MPTLTLLQNITTTWLQNAVATNYFNVGPQFFPEHDGEIQSFNWYRASVGTLRKPTRMQLWDVATQTKLAESTTLIDTEAVGWNVTPIDPPIAVTAGQLLAVTGVQPVGNTQAYLAQGT